MNQDSINIQCDVCGDLQVSLDEPEIKQYCPVCRSVFVSAGVKRQQGCLTSLVLFFAIGMLFAIC